MSEEWYGVDLDGTLASYEHGQGMEIGEPLLPMVDRVKRMLGRGLTVKVLTARPKSHHKIIKLWCTEVFGYPLAVTSAKDFGMVALFDDRAISVERNTGYVKSAILPPECV